MRLQRALTLFLLAACSHSLVLAATPAAAQGLSAVREVEGVHEYRLPNGLQVLLIPDASKPTTTVNVTYRVGSRMEGAGETGMAHLLEHLMFKSTRSLANVGAELSKRGMQFNGSTNADRTNYYESFPADARQLAWVLQTEAERMTGALVSRKDLDSEMTVVRNEMEAGENNAVGMLVQKTQAIAYQWHSYGKSTIGARSDVEHVSIPHLQAFYRQYYQPDNATLIVAGAFEPAQTLQQIARYFGRLPRPQRVLAPTYTQEPVQDGERALTLRRIGGEQALFATYHIPALASPEYAAFEIIINALSDTPTGRLHQRLVAPGLATGVFGWASRNAEPGLMNVGVVLKQGDSLAQAEQILLSTVEGLAAEPITAEELQRTQRQWRKALDQTMADPQQLCLSLSETIAAGDWRLLFSLRDQIQRISLAEVNAAAGRWILPSNRSLGRFMPTETPVRAPLAGPVDAAAALQDFKPQAGLRSGESFDSRAAALDPRTERYTLPSGLRVALLPKKSRGQTVVLSLSLHFGDENSLKGQRLAAELVGAWLATGTRSKSRAQLSDAFDALNTDWSLQSDALHGASASLTTRREQLAPALTLLTQVLREPAFAPEEFEQLRRQQLAELERARQEPTAVASLALSRALSSYPPGDVRHVATVPEDIAALQALPASAVQSFYQTQWGASHGELAIVGDFDPAEIKPLIAQSLGNWASPLPYARVTTALPSTSGLQLTALLKDKPNAIALGVLPLPLADTDADYAALSLATHVLGAGGFNSRLLTRLRQQDGLSYGAGASLSASSFEPKGALNFYAIFAPQNRVRVEQAMAQELARFVKHGITQAELSSAQQAMLAAGNTRRSNDAALAQSWAAKLERQRSFAWDAALEARRASLSLAEVNAAIQRWIDPRRVSWSLAGDFDKRP